MFVQHHPSISEDMVSIWYDAVLPVISSLVVLEQQFFGDSSQHQVGNRAGVTNRVRCRRPIEALFEEYGPIYGRRAYRMNKESFDFLHSILKTKLAPKKRTRLDLSNDGIPSETKLSVALRFFAGGDPLDIMVTHGISQTSVYRCVWAVVDAVNATSSLAIEFPSDHEAKKKLPGDFSLKVKLDFSIIGEPFVEAL